MEVAVVLFYRLYIYIDNQGSYEQVQGQLQKKVYAVIYCFTKSHVGPWI